MKSLKNLTLLGLCLGLSACDPGLTEYGYLYNPKGILAKLLDHLKTNDFEGDWILLFDSDLVCTYTSEEGIESLKRSLGNLETVQKRFQLEQPVLLKSSPELERYRTRLIRNQTGNPLLTFLIDCHHETQNGNQAHYCEISRLIDHESSSPQPVACSN